MEINLENVHVVIYSKKMLKEAVKRLHNEGQKIDKLIFNHFEKFGCDLLIYHEGEFKVVDLLPHHDTDDVSLNILCEMVISLDDQKYKLGDIVFSELKHNPGAGFIIQHLSRQDIVDFHNSRICKDLYNTKKITSEQADFLRKEIA